jgi:Tol biopolymer transport system component
MRPPSRFGLLAVGAPLAAFVVVFVVSLTAFGLDGDERPNPAAKAGPEGKGRVVFTLSADTAEPAEGYLASARLDGSDVRPITEAPEAGLASDDSPAVSPDGTVVAFQRSVPGESPHIYVVGIDGTGLRRLTEGPAAEIAPAWSPDGTRIAFSRAVGDRFDLVVSDADGSRLTQLTQTPNADEDGASWSPNGAQLVFTRFARDNEDLWVIDVDGANAHALVRGPHEDSSPAWAADGARIALVRDGRIALFTFERFEVEFLTPAGLVKEAGPSWSPDGDRIVFTRDPGTILVVDADGAKATPVPFDGQATGAVWVPAA